MKALFPRMAAVNLRNNRSAYLPYLLTGSLCVAMFYIILTFAISPEMAEVPYATGAVALFLLGTVIIGIFCAALLFYANGFLIRRRKREFGLYSVLGMEKRHVGIVLLFESVYACAASLILGLVFGTLLAQLLFGVLTRLLTFDVSFQLSFCDSAANVTCILFGVLFGILYLYNLMHLYSANPITLLRGEQSGEREPRASWILTLAGLASLGGGYAIAVLCNDAAKSLGDFFLAVLLVILGTFCLFTSGSIHLLKALRRSKKFYYKPENFISVSGMLYRMKRNAAGLASVCILFTMLLVTISTTVCLYLGQEAALNAMYPTNITLSGAGETAEDVSAMRAEIDRAAQSAGVSISDPLIFRMSFAHLTLKDGALIPYDNATDASSYFASIIPLSDYNAMTQQTTALGEEEFLLYSPSLSGVTSAGGLRCAGEASLPDLLAGNAALGNSVWIVCPDGSSLVQALEGSAFGVNAYVDVLGDEAAQRAFAQQVDSSPYSVFCRADVSHDWYALYGCFLFLGLFFGALFLMGVGLILYYKQISEGVDDRRNFEIMQKVGLSKPEARRVIGRQILLVFFLPLVAAALHLAFAYHIICNMLSIFGITDQVLFAALCAATYCVCAAVYFALYRLTSRAYYRLVQA